MWDKLLGFLSGKLHTKVLKKYTCSVHWTYSGHCNFLMLYAFDNVLVRTPNVVVYCKIVTRSREKLESIQDELISLKMLEEFCFVLFGLFE